MLIVARTSSSELIDSESSVPEGSEGSNWEGLGARGEGDDRG